MDRRLGATPRVRGGCHFELWAPHAKRVEVELVQTGRRLRMDAQDDGYFSLDAPDLEPGARYAYRLDDRRARPDPASRSQPGGVFRPSEYVDLDFPWSDARWKGHRRDALVIYELHVGTYTKEGTFEAIIPHLAGLASLGVTAIEIMPVAQFSGTRNWGYDGVFLGAPQNTYGGPRGLQRLVDAAHTHGLSVLLDVVYNHVGPEGNILPDFGRYFNTNHSTPWGSAINVDGPQSDHVRRFLTENALLWLEEYHMDGLRLDAVHAIVDYSAKTFMETLAETTHQKAAKRGSPFHLIAESSANDPRYVRPQGQHGWGLDATWNDDFSRSLYTFTTHDRTGYRGDYDRFACLAKSYENAFVFDGTYSRYRRRRHGRPPTGVESSRFVVCADNHDQTGNRARGERLASLVSFEMLKVSAAAVILSPFLPMLFMGEEYADPSPFLYFTDHRSAALRNAVTKGRKREFQEHGWSVEPFDHAVVSTFNRSKLRHEKKQKGGHHHMLAWYRRLLELRRTHPVLRRLDHRATRATASEREAFVAIVRQWSARRTLLVLHSGTKRRRVEFDVPRGTWTRVLDSNEEQWNGPGTVHPASLRSDGHARLELAPETAVLYEMGGSG
jgi:maltooligosyltrehalose trehalohydrolase